VFYASLMLKTGHPDKAERLAREALRIDADLQSAHGMLGLVLAERREKQAAHGHAEHSLALDPGHEGAHAAMGVTLLRTGHPLRARAHLREALRLDPDPETEELFLQADKCARWIYLPMYWWTLLIDRLPGKQFTVWGVVVGGLVVAPALGVPDRLIVVVAIAYIAFVVYTWVADGLVAAWVRMRPPR
jgi:tetratricopeptide (TPR) repeat protein